MNDLQRREWSQISGKLALITTLVYVTLGILAQAKDILVHSRAPSLLMMTLACLTFLSWTVWAILKRERAPLIANSVGLLTSLVVVVLTLWVQTSGVTEFGNTPKDRSTGEELVVHQENQEM